MGAARTTVARGASSPAAKAQRFHLIVDVMLGPSPSADGQFVETLLTEIARLIDMKILSGPHVVDGVEGNPGVSGFAIIDYSHISIHTFSAFRQIMVDVFSCKEYSRRAVIDYLAEKLHAKRSDMETRTISWG